MDCFICRESNWMQEKCLGFLRNLLKNHKERIDNAEVFLPLERNGAEKLLADLVRKRFPKDVIKKISSNCGCRLDLDDSKAHENLCALWNAEKTHHELVSILPLLFENAIASPWGDNGRDVFHEKMLEVQNTLKLTDDEVDVLLVSLAISEKITTVPSAKWSRPSSPCLFMMSKCLNRKEASILNMVSPQSPLRRFECLDDDLNFSSAPLRRFLCGLSDEPLASCFFTKDSSETLPWSDFSNLAERHGKILKRILASGDKPTNILLYGAPGTGKTSFARALAKEVGRNCYSISQSVMDDSGRECRTSSSPAFRFGALQVCDEQINPAESMIIVDEADEMLSGGTRLGRLFRLFGGGASSHSTADKGLLNTVLDTIKTSTIWITNTPAEDLDESSRRRFDYSIRFAPLNCEQRKCIWRNNIARLKMGRLIGGKQLEEFSALYPVSAGGISQTLENLKRMHPRKSEVPRLVEQLMKPHCELLGVELANDKLPPSKDYSLEGLNIQGDVKLERIVEAIRAFQHHKGDKDPDRPRMNLLLSGAPGTGKTEFVKYLGDVLKTRVNVMMGSNLLSMWHGETEQNIALAFRQAEEEHAILFLDEIDGLVQSRTNAQHSWEVTQVNELLHQMENFNGVMIGATNFIQNLDQAIMRRFTFKLQFNFLDDEGKRLFFERMFKSKLTDDELLRLKAIPNLAPGDFRTVRQSLFYYGGVVTNAKRLEALESEAASKEGGAFTPHGKIGFC
ncbi:MAG: AAA family ATPase [Oligosphaeraceae bacterium]